MLISFTEYRPFFERFSTPDLTRLMENLRTQTGLAWGVWYDDDDNNCPARHSDHLLKIEEGGVTCRDQNFLNLASQFAGEWDATVDSPHEACKCLLGLLTSIYNARTARAQKARMIHRIFLPIPRVPKHVFADHSAESAHADQFEPALA